MNRKIKDFIIKNYFNFRINTVESPYKIRLKNKDYKFIFLCSHMRSGSSLLTHILASNPEIIGYGETHINYSLETDLKQLVNKVYSKTKSYKMNENYVLDKVLHNNKFEDYSFLSSDHIKTIFLLREPKRTLSSILLLKPHWTPQQALHYYCDRISKLEDYAQLIDDKNSSLLVTYEQIVDHSTQVFDTLQNFLNTKEGFSEEYQVMKTTGIKGVGDSSVNIKAGKIIKTSKSQEVEIDQDLLQVAMDCFQKGYDNLSKYCQKIQV